MTMREKQILVLAMEIRKRKFGVTTHFLEIIKQQFSKKTLVYKAIYGIFFFFIFFLLKLYYL